jgi:hypothetical protein
MHDGELTIPVKFHPSGLWVGLAVTVSDQQTLFMVLDTGSPASVISPRVTRELVDRGLLQQTAEPHHYSLVDLSAEDAAGKPALPDLTVRTLRKLTLLRIDGLLGLDFFRQFDRICFDFPTSSLTLSPAPPRQGQGSP